MLRITIDEPKTRLLVHLDGKLMGPWVEVTRSALSVALGSDELCIDLQNLSFVDEAGIALLRSYRRNLIPMVGASPWIEQQLACNPHVPSRGAT